MRHYSVEQPVRTRIAPSPTGNPHIATMYMALFDFAFAKQNKGKFIVRTEDTDRTRYIEGSTDKLFEALAWLHLNPDESIIHNGPYGPYLQSERLHLYEKYAKELLRIGHAYHCFCSKERLEELRKTQLKNGQQPKYDRHCLHLPQESIHERIEKGESYVIRMLIPDNEKIIVNDLIRGEITFDTNQIDDQVLIKSDGYPTYHLAVVVDDHLMEISHILRGEEWISSTPKHILLYRFFGWNIPAVAHLQILRNKDRSKMSKRKGDVSVESYRNRGFLPEAVINYLGLLGNPNSQNIEIFDLEYIVNNFSFEKIPLTGPIFDEQKLEWMNGVYIRRLTLDELQSRLLPFIHLDISQKNEKYLRKCIALIQERLKRFDEADSLLELFYVRPENDLREDRDILKDLLLITETDLDDAQAMETKIREYAIQKGLKAGEVFTILRDSITGKKATPPLIPLMQVLGKEESILRIKNSIGE